MGTIKTLVWIALGLLFLNVVTAVLYVREIKKHRVEMATFVVAQAIRTDSLDNVINNYEQLLNSLDKKTVVYRDRIRYINAIAPIFEEDSLINSINQTLQNY